MFDYIGIICFVWLLLRSPTLALIGLALAMHWLSHPQCIANAKPMRAGKGLGNACVVAGKDCRATSWQ
ncbi:MAG: hypothetical protein RBS43_05015 [Candidatus Cloacimonas sp.]|nr:hypothetical protein [Candidatus Cloacimonas sp.]